MSQYRKNSINKHYALGRLKPGVMNRTETAYATYLKLLQTRGEILWFTFESMTFKLAKDTRYTPDFAVLLENGEMEFHEVKGSKKIFADDAKVKVKIAAEQFPFRFVVVYPIAQKDGGGWLCEKVGE